MRQNRYIPDIGNAAKSAGEYAKAINDKRAALQTISLNETRSEESFLIQETCNSSSECHQQSNLFSTQLPWPMLKKRNIEFKKSDSRPNVWRGINILRLSEQGIHDEKHICSAIPPMMHSCANLIIT